MAPVPVVLVVATLPVPEIDGFGTTIPFVSATEVTGNVMMLTSHAADVIVPLAVIALVLATCW
jgi:hypothetical protein